MKDQKEWLKITAKDIKRFKEKKPATLLGIVFYGGTLGILFVLPVVFGAYFGRWLDTMVSGYSVRWTMSFIIIGIALGFYSVMRFLRGKL